MKTKPIAIVTGGNGFLGTEVCLELIGLGWAVHVIDPEPPGWNSCPESRLEAVRRQEEKALLWEPADMTECNDLNPGASVVIHLAAEKGVRMRGFDLLNHNLQTDLALLDAYQRMESKPPLLWASSAAIYAKTVGNTPYGVGKQMSEMLALTLAPEACMMRIFNLSHPSAGDGVEAVMRARAATGNPIEVHGDGTQTRDFIDVREAGRLIAATAQRSTEKPPPRAVDICTGAEQTVVSVAMRVSQETGTLVRFMRDAPRGPERSCGNPRPLRKYLGIAEVAQPQPLQAS